MKKVALYCVTLHSTLGLFGYGPGLFGVGQLSG